MSFNFVIVKSDDFHRIIVEWCRKISLSRGWKSQISNSIADSADEIFILCHKMPLDNNCLDSSRQEIRCVRNKQKGAHFLRVPMKSLHQGLLALEVDYIDFSKVISKSYQSCLLIDNNNSKKRFSLNNIWIGWWFLKKIMNH